MHPAAADMLRHFRTDHLPEYLAAVSRPFGDIANWLVADESDGGLALEGAEATTALRKLLEAKDCAVRAALPPE